MKIKDEEGGNIMEYSAGHVLFHEGDEGREMFYILEGEVLISKNIEGRNIEIARLGEGDIFGEMALIREHPRTATAITATDARLLSITRENFEEKMRDNPGFAWHIMNSLAKRLEKTTDELMMLKYIISG
jgi:CRP-like cAMP-binding protein